MHYFALLFYFGVLTSLRISANGCVVLTLFLPSAKSSFKVTVSSPNSVYVHRFQEQHRGDEDL